MTNELSWTDVGVSADDREENFVRHGVDGLAYITAKVDCKQTGDVWKGLCPFHHERTPSFTVYPADARQSHGWASFYCYGCQKGGDVIQFAMLYHGLSSRAAAVKHLEREHNLEYNDDAALNELKLALREDIEGPAHETVDVASVNFTCALAVRRLLETVHKQRPQTMDQAFIEVDRLTKFIDHQLHECTPAALAQLPDLVFARVDELQTCLLGK